jgi:hypothetical protein
MTIRVRYQTPHWIIEQDVVRRIPQHESSFEASPDITVPGWEVRGIYDNFYTTVIETMQLAVEEGQEQIESIDIAWIPPGAPLIAALRSGLTSLTL